MFVHQIAIIYSKFLREFALYVNGHLVQTDVEANKEHLCRTADNLALALGIHPDRYETELELEWEYVKRMLVSGGVLTHVEAAPSLLPR